MNKIWIISDLHISHNYSTLEKVDIELIFSFILKQPVSGIIFNGDTFDFARTYAIPAGYNPCNLEKKYGLNNNEENSIRKMQMIIDSNKYFFDMLKNLIEKGFKISFLYGNHDSELRLSSIQSLIVDRIGAQRSKDISFGINYQIGDVFISHGHQYDPENRIIYNSLDNSEEYSFGYMTTKYFGNIVEKEKRLPRNDISAGEYFVWVFKNFKLRSFIFILQYFIYAIKVLKRSGSKFIKSNKEEEDDIYAKPLMSSIYMTIKRLYLIQVTAFLCMLLIMLIAVIFSMKKAFILMVSVGLLVCLIPLFKIGNRDNLGRLLNQAAHRLREIYKVVNIVFGHNHYALRSDKDRYFSSIPFKDGFGLRILKYDNGNFSYQIIE